MPNKYNKVLNLIKAYNQIIWHMFDKQNVNHISIY